MLKSQLLLLVTLSATHLLAAMSPGPSFIFVARTAVAQSRANGLAAAVGMGVGAAAWGAAAMLGLQALLVQIPALYTALQFIGGAFLLYIAWMLWQHAHEPLPVVEAARDDPTDLGRSFWAALTLQLGNPKVIFFFGSIFVALLPADFPIWMAAIMLGIMFLNETLWYALVAAGFALPRPRAFYVRAKPWIDRATAGLLGALGLKLMLGER